MESDRHVPSTSSAERAAEGPILGPQPVFWKELYWFVLILLGAWIAALLVLPPRLARNRKALELERELEAVVAHLERTESRYEGAIQGLENDRYFRIGAYRRELGAKQNNESFLKAAGESSDNSRDGR